MAQDYAEKFVANLAGQFDNSPKLRALVSAILNALTDLENEADQLTANRWIDTAEGKQLDGCGYIVGEYRNGRDDEAYRAAIKFRIFVNISEGTPSDLIKGIKFLTAPTDCQYLESYPATAILFTDGYSVPSDIHDQLQNMAPAAISDVPVCVSYTGKPFRFSKAPPAAELFVNDNYLTAQGSDLQVSTTAGYVAGSTLGGIVPAELDVGIGYLDLGGPTLAVYNPNTLGTLGHDNLTGVFQ
jgi:hypothetical protein